MKVTRRKVVGGTAVIIASILGIGIATDGDPDNDKDVEEAEVQFQGNSSAK